MPRSVVVAVVCLTFAACGGGGETPGVGGGGAAAPLADVVDVRSDFRETATVRDLRDELVVSTPVLSDIVWGPAPRDRSAGLGTTAIDTVLDGCDQLTPTTWRFTGHMAADAYPAPITFLMGLERTLRGSDVISTQFIGSQFDATLQRDGAFAIDLPIESAPTAPRDDDLRCVVHQSGSSATHAPVFRHAPLVWDAPDDSIQALGSGVVLADPADPRQAWAEMYWRGTDVGFDQLWIPPTDEFVARHVRALRYDDCLRVDIGYEYGHVILARGCTSGSGDGPERPFDADIAPPDGFHWLLVDGNEPNLERQLPDGTVLRVGYADPLSLVPDEIIDGLVAMAGRLRPHPNVPD